MTASAIKHAEIHPKASDLEAFAAKVWEQGALHRRELPWRFIDDAYAVLVSEVMLQQTQVVRVLKYWPAFLGRFPSIDALAAADSAAVLESWQGLGYNRRALALKRTADVCSRERGGELPDTVDELVKLPGIGPATAAGVVAFAYDRPAMYLETNVRSVFIHEFFGETGDPIADKQIIPLVEATCSTERPREWYYALLDYGAHLKRVTDNPSRKSAHHAKQSAFDGSRRQKRAEVLRAVLDEPGIAEAALLDRLDAVEIAAGRATVDPALFASILEDMVAEGFLGEENGCYSV